MKNNKSIVLSVAMVSVFLIPTSVFAHAHLVKSEPAQNSVLQEMPKTISIQFSEPLELAMCKLEVNDIETDKLVSEGKPTASENRETLQVKLKLLVQKKKRQFEVTWRAVAKDTHKINGKYSFSIEN